MDRANFNANPAVFACITIDHVISLSVENALGGTKRNANLAAITFRGDDVSSHLGPLLCGLIVGAFDVGNGENTFEVLNNVFRKIFCISTL
jgi:hypothetical protein